MKKQTTQIVYHSPTVSSSYHHIFSQTTGSLRKQNKHLSFNYKTPFNQFKVIKLQPQKY